MSSQSVTRQTTAALAELHGRFLHFLRRRIADPATAEDILQSAYVKAMQHEGELRDSESSVAWFYRILRNAVADHYRRLAAHSRVMDQWTASWKEEYEPELEAESCACIREVVRGLRAEYRVAIEQVDLGGKSVAAFARAHRLTPGNASVRLHRARKAVAKKLTAVCGASAAYECMDCTCQQSVR